MTASPAPTLAARWIAASQSHPVHDQDVVEIVAGALKGESVNEGALLRSLLAHADALAAAGTQTPASGAAQ